MKDYGPKSDSPTAMRCWDRFVSTRLGQLGFQTKYPNRLKMALRQFFRWTLCRQTIFQPLKISEILQISPKRWLELCSLSPMPMLHLQRAVSPLLNLVLVAVAVGSQRHSGWWTEHEALGSVKEGLSGLHQMNTLRQTVQFIAIINDAWAYLSLFHSWQHN